MMRSELEDRVGKLENWQWELAEYVYMNDNSIKDVGGKDQLAQIIKDGGWLNKWPNLAPINQMYKDLNGPVIIKYTREDLYSTWEVTHTGYCINDKPKTQTAVCEAVKIAYEKQYPELASHVEYFSTTDSDVRYGHKPDIWPTNDRIAVFYVRGGSEGFYVHVEALNEGHQCLMLIKTLLEAEDGIKWAEQTVNAISRIMKV